MAIQTEFYTICALLKVFSPESQIRTDQYIKAIASFVFMTKLPLHTLDNKAHSLCISRHYTMEAIGKLIKQELMRQELTVTWFARKLSCHRTNVYDIFARDNIDMTLLIRISRILQHNFVKDLSEMVDKEIFPNHS